MIKQIRSSDIKKFLETNPKTVLLDVRTEDEWKTIGKPDTKILVLNPSLLQSRKTQVF